MKDLQLWKMRMEETEELQRSPYYGVEVVVPAASVRTP